MSRDWRSIWGLGRGAVKLKTHQGQIQVQTNEVQGQMQNGKDAARYVPGALPKTNK